MCIIIDTNRINHFIDNPEAKDTKPIHDWFDEKRHRVMVYPAGGKFSKELRKKVRTKLRQLSQKGVAIRFKNSNKIKSEEEILKNIKCESNDKPLLAFARACGARLLYTADEKLKSDFKNRRIINPKGSIYSDERNEDLLERTVCKKITEQPINSAQNEDYGDN